MAQRQVGLEHRRAEKGGRQGQTGMQAWVTAKETPTTVRRDGDAQCPPASHTEGAELAVTRGLCLEWRWRNEKVVSSLSTLENLQTGFPGGPPSARGYFRF